MNETTHRVGAWAEIAGLVRDDLRGLAAPVAGWWMVLAFATLHRISVIDRLGASDFESLFGPITRVLFWLAPLVAGLVTRRHAVHRQAFWRTRPWRRSRLVAALGIEVFAFVWFPTVAAQHLLLARLDLFDSQRWLWTLELAISPGAWVLMGAALGAVSASARNLLVAFLGAYLGVMALQMLAMLAASNGYPPALGETTALAFWAPRGVLLGLVSLGTFVLAYRGVAPRRIVFSASCVLVPGWLLAAGLSFDEVSALWPRNEQPEMRASALVAPGANGDASASQKIEAESSEAVSLCVQADFEGTAESVRARPRAYLVGVGHLKPPEIGQRVGSGRSTLQLGSMSRVSFERLREDVVGLQLDLELDRIEPQSMRALPLRVGAETSERTATMSTVRIHSVRRDGDLLEVVTEHWALRRLFHLESTAIRLHLDDSAPQPLESENRAALEPRGFPAGFLLFDGAQSVRRYRQTHRWSLSAAERSEGEDQDVSTLRWWAEEVLPRAHRRTRLVLDARLADLSCS